MVLGALAYLVLIIFAAIYIYPFLLQIATSFKTTEDATAHPLALIPRPWTVDAFRTLADTNYTRWFANSTIIAVFVTFGRVFFDSLAGYALARLHFRGRGSLMAAILAVMAVPGVVLLIPKYLMLVQLHMFNTYYGMIIPLMADAAGVFIMRQFFISIPLEIEEAARIDGAGTFRVYWSVVLPMARPALIALTILSFQASWKRVLLLPGGPQQRRPQHPDHRCGATDLGAVGRRKPIPAEDVGRAADDDPDRLGVLRLPAVFRPGGQCRRGEGLSRPDAGDRTGQSQPAPSAGSGPATGGPAPRGALR